LTDNIFDAYLNEPGNPNSLPSNDITDVWSDEGNHLWLTVAGAGLCEFDGKVFKQYLRLILHHQKYFSQYMPIIKTGFG